MCNARWEQKGLMLVSTAPKANSIASSGSSSSGPAHEVVLGPAKADAREVRPVVAIVIQHCHEGQEASSSLQ